MPNQANYLFSFLLAECPSFSKQFLLISSLNREKMSFQKAAKATNESVNMLGVTTMNRRFNTILF